MTRTLLDAFHAVSKRRLLRTFARRTNELAAGLTLGVGCPRLMMSGTAIALASVLALLPPPSQAVTQDNFLARTTSDLVALCSMHVGAIHFCEGYFVGADHYSLAERGSGAPNLFCPPTPPPTRD
jgi:hypothetical protein